MFSGTSQGLLEEFCNKVAAQLSEVSQDVDQLKGFQSQMDEWKHKLEGHILKHREVSGVMQSEIRDRQAKVQGVSDDIQELETGLSQVASWSQLIQETITKASDDNEKEKKMAQAAQLLAECSGADQEEFLAPAKKFMQEKKVRPVELRLKFRSLKLSLIQQMPSLRILFLQNSWGLLPRLRLRSLLPRLRLRSQLDLNSWGSHVRRNSELNEVSLRLH